jgi:hypothetical protein
MPAIHTVSIVHLCFVAAFLALYACEVVVEASHSRDELHPTAIRIHFLLDIFVEIPLILGILISGIILAVLVDELTFAHLWLITCGTIVVLACFISFFKFVRTRKRLLDEQPIDHEALVRIRNRFGAFSFIALNPPLLATLVLGFWLAHQRALEAFCR